MVEWKSIPDGNFVFTCNHFLLNVRRIVLQWEQHFPHGGSFIIWFNLWVKKWFVWPKHFIPKQFLKSLQKLTIYKIISFPHKSNKVSKLFIRLADMPYTKFIYISWVETLFFVQTIKTTGCCMYISSHLLYIWNSFKNVYKLYQTFSILFIILWKMK